MQHSRDATLVNNAGIAPRYLRFPRPGESCPLTGLSRGYLRKLVDKGEIDTIKLGDQKNKRVARVIDAESLVRYIERYRNLPQPN